MRVSNRLCTGLLSLLLTTLSCAIAPGGVERSAPSRASEVDRNPPAEVVRAEAAEIAHFLRSEETGLLPAEITHLSRVIVVEAHRAGLAPEIVLAVIRVESGGDNFAVSRAGARGLMQLLPRTAENVARWIGMPWRGPDSLFDPATNVRLGVRYLEHMVERYGSLPTALAAYNWGPEHIAERIRLGEPIPGAYAERVMAVYNATAPVRDREI